MIRELRAVAARPIDMRAHRFALVALAAVLAVGGCTAAPSPEPSPSRATPSPVAPSASGPGPSAVRPPPAGRPSSPPPLSPTRKPPMPPPPSEIQNPLPGPERRLTGTVTRSAGCTVLVVGTRRWALVGHGVTTLADGTLMRVTGTLTTVPTGCAADMALSVTRAEPAST
jgi:hypothetical protein